MYISIKEEICASSFIYPSIYLNFNMGISTTLRNLRKSVAGLSVVAIVASLFATSVSAATTGNIFTDVSPEAWFAPYVNQLAEAGVIDTTKDTYRPSELVNRAEMAKFAVAAAGITMEKATEAPFKDVSLGQWYTDPIYTAAKNGIVSNNKKDGVATGMYRPSDSLNRAEAAKIIVNAFQFAEDTTGAPHFPDVKSSDWFYLYVETAFNAGIINGYPDGTFGPAKNINRAEVAKMLALAMDGGMVDEFTLESAAAATSTKVELIFSMPVDMTSAEVTANYMIEDSTGAKLEVKSAEYISDDTVHLTTATQTEGKTYYVTAKNVESEMGDELANTDSVSFLGYGADVSGGALDVKLSTQTPVAGSVPSGATGVVFTCWDFKAGSDDVMLKSLHVKRVGAGSQTSFTDVYLYRGEERLTTGRSINSETQKVEFNNINQEIASGENAKICLVADLAGDAQSSVHSFELSAKEDVVSNASSMSAMFPLKGTDQLITSATVGTTTIKKNGSLDELTVSQKGGRIAQFELEANGSEDQLVNRIALYVRGSVTVSDIKNLQLFTEGETTALAKVSEVGNKDLATFVLDKPYKLGRGQRKIFYVTADLSPGRNGDDIKVYLDESTDLSVKGVTFGYGTKVISTGYDGSASNFSLVTIKGSTFNVAFTGPAAQDIATGQNSVRCLDLTISNASGSDVEIKDWLAQIEVTNTPSAAGGLWNTTDNTSNYTLVKLARLNDDGSIAGSLLGPSELASTTDVGTGNDKIQSSIKLVGTSTIKANETVKAAIVFNTANNTALSGDKIRCTLKNLVNVSDSVRDLNGDALGSSSITPSSDLTGNTMTLTQSALKVAVASTPTSKNVVKGTNNVDLLGISLVSGSSLSNTVKNLVIQGYVDNDTTGAFVTTTAGTVNLKDVVTSLSLYDGSTQVGIAASINSTTGKVTFNNLNVSVPKNTTKTLTLKGNISNSTPDNARVKFAVTSTSDVVSIDQNGQTVSGIDVTTATNGLDQDSGVRITVKSSGSVNVSESGSDAGALVGGLTTGTRLGKVKFTVTNADATLDDFAMGVSGEPATLSRVYVYDSACAVKLGSPEGYTVVNGAVSISGANINLPVGNTTLCFTGDIASVKDNGSDQPTSGSRTGLYLRDVTKLTSGGSEISSTINSSAIVGGTLSVAMAGETSSTNLCTSANIGRTVGNIVVVEEEMMVVTTATAAAADATPCDLNSANGSTSGFVTVVSRAFAGTSASSHAVNAEIRTPSFVVASTSAQVKKDDIIITLNGTDIDYYIALQDAPTLAAHAIEIYADSTATAFVPANTMARFNIHGNTSVVRKAYPKFANANSLESIVGGNVIPSGSTEEQRKITAISISALGEGSVELKKQPTVTNSGQVRFNITGAALNTGATGYCAIYDKSGNKLAGLGNNATTANADGVIDKNTGLAVVDTLASGLNTFVLGYDDPTPVGSSVLTSGLVIQSGQTDTMVLKCNIDASAAGAQSIQASLVDVAYSDGTVLGQFVSDLNLYVDKFVNLIGPNQGEII